MSSNLSTRTKDSGALGKPGSSRLIFNQEMRGFKSHTPCQQDCRIWILDCDGPPTETRAPLLTSPIGNHKSAIENVSVGRSSTGAEHRTVNAAVEGSTPFDPPKTLFFELCILCFASLRSCSLFLNRLEIACSRRRRASFIRHAKNKAQSTFWELWPRGEALGCQPSR
jgi:hypothetical protein